MSTLILGIESSCDDTAAAVLRDREILSNVVQGQTSLHSDYGGVVPEIAARAHAERLDVVVEQALSDAGVELADLDGIAATAGPGLIGGVMAGLMTGKALAAATQTPFLAVNHLAGHALTPMLTDGVEPPFLMLLVSGGHCQFLLVQETDRFERWGGTIDDAPGEAFDKVARLLALPQPGGPSIEAVAKDGDAGRFALPRPLLDREDLNVSFSGLKTAALRARDSCLVDGTMKRQDQADLAASFQAAVAEVLQAKTARALDRFLDLSPPAPTFAIAGGVAANQPIRTGLQSICAERDVAFVAPPLALCTDNAAMIAFAGLLQLQAGQTSSLDAPARPRWPLDEAAAPLLGSGKKGAKA